MALQGDVRTLRALAKALRKLPITASARIAARAAPEMTSLAGGAYDAGQTVYGSARPRGVDGNHLALERTGTARRAMQFHSTGTQVRTAKFPEYVRYLIGKYDVLPNGPLPQTWRDRLTEVAAQVLYADIQRGGQ
jgi:hypothetical protein